MDKMSLLNNPRRSKRAVRFFAPGHIGLTISPYVKKVSLKSTLVFIDGVYY